MTDDINALRARISELEALIFSSGKPISQFGTISLPRSVVEQAMYHLNRGDADAVCWADGVIKPALEQPQRKLTQQDIAYSALLGNIESSFNACMHQEHCKRWKDQAEALLAQHVDECHDLGPGGAELREYQRIITDLEAAAEDDYAWSKHLAHEAAEALRSLLSENKPAQPPALEQAQTQSGETKPGWKSVPVEPTQEMMRAWVTEITPKNAWAAMLDAAPQPQVVGQSDNDTVPVLRSLLGAACAAINRKQDDPKLLEQLRRYTTGDLSQPAGEWLESEGRQAFEAWCYSAGLMQQSHGIVSISSHTDTAWLAWQAAAAPKPPVNQQLREASQQALQALQVLCDEYGRQMTAMNRKTPRRAKWTAALSAIAALSQAIEAEQQVSNPVESHQIEPVAVVDFTTEKWRKIVDALRTLPDGAQLYTRQQPAQEPLTDEAKAVIDAARAAMDESTESYNGRGDISIASELAAALSLRLDEYDRAIEAAHGIGSKA